MTRSLHTPLPLFTRLVSRLRMFVRIALSADYARDIDPEEYEEHVSMFQRHKLAKHVASVVYEHVSPKNTPKRVAHVLDIAAGTGILSCALQKLGYRVTASDLSPNALDYLSRKYPGIKTISADMNQPFPILSGTFDAVTILWGNRYITSTPAFLQEVYRLLRTGGIFVWPIFPGEAVLWKLRNGIFQHTGLSSLAQEAQHIGFTLVKKSFPRLFSVYRAIHISPDQVPGYVILRK